MDLIWVHGKIILDGLCRESALGPIREIPPELIQSIPLDSVRPLELRDFLSALSQVRASVSQKDLDLYVSWNKEYGSMQVDETLSN